MYSAVDGVENIVAACNSLQMDVHQLVHVFNGFVRGIFKEIVFIVVGAAKALRRCLYL
jgi:ABC-type thiamin/hydroxymethylpyrimidine transport system permease subunit